MSEGALFLLSYGLAYLCTVALFLTLLLIAEKRKHGRD